MEFRKKVELPLSNLKIYHASRMVLLGSCFAENIGKRLVENKFKVNVNPFGILYNPASVCQAINDLIDEKIFEDDDSFQYQGVFHTFSHHSSFSDTDKVKFLERINDCRKQASDDLKHADLILITFGTSYVFRQKETGNIVANCHKLPPTAFDRSRLTVEEIVCMWDILIGKLRKINPSVKILFTVSPIRHWKDGAHNNQLSKAILLLSIDQLSERHDDISYFPSYEIVLDELRDYRFYAEDMNHPSDMAINYIWERFADTYFNSQTVEANRKWQHIRKALSHRPFDEKTENHKQFLRQTLLKIKDLQNKYPYFDCKKEIQFLEEKLSDI